jgi:phosphate acyltransferase
VCIIAHGSSKASSICNAIRVAKDAVENEVLDRIRTQIKELNAVTEEIK